ncbi:hypothetical protein, partial [Auritidibacter ignavus]|uniref:hypothetical protein n=1 Tax=Auritidibacter ignavus TaxID=678932 RepID=UPI002FE6027B
GDNDATTAQALFVPDHHLTHQTPPSSSADCRSVATDLLRIRFVEMFPVVLGTGLVLGHAVFNLICYYLFRWVGLDCCVTVHEVELGVLTLFWLSIRAYHGHCLG